LTDLDVAEVLFEKSKKFIFAGTHQLREKPHRVVVGLELSEDLFEFTVVILDQTVTKENKRIGSHCSLDAFLLNDFVNLVMIKGFLFDNCWLDRSPPLLFRMFVDFGLASFLLLEFPALMSAASSHAA
jgi:hypothetical protein